MLGDRFNRSWEVAKQSYAVLKANPSLAFFPVISGIATIIASVPFLVVIVLAAIGKQASHQHFAFSTMHYAALACTYFVNYFLVIFFNSALVACANENLQGRPTSMQFGLQMAIQRLPQILAWTAVASTVGLALRLISERVGFVGAIISGIFGFLWNIAVFFVVPVLVIDRESPIAAIKTSAGMLKQTWGERIILGIGIGMAFGVLSLIGVIPFILAIAFFVAGLWPLGIFALIACLMYFLVLAVVGSATTTIYQTALYLYCRHGAIPAGFNPELLQQAFMPKPQSKLVGYFRH